MTADELAALHAACFTVPRPWTAREFATFLASPQVLLVAAPQGFALGRVISDEAELLTIAVDPAARRRGTGQALLSDLMALVTTRGAREMFLEVSRENDSAITLYRTMGFTEAGIRKAYYSDAGRPIDALVMRRELSAEDLVTTVFPM